MKTGLPAWIPAARLRGRAFWVTLAVREQWLLGSAGTLLAGTVFCWVALAPAMDTWRTTAVRHEKLDAQLQTMRALASEAVGMQSLPRTDPIESRKTLELSVQQRLGQTAQLVLAGDRATLTLAGASAQSLAEWLVDARSSAKAVPGEAHLKLNQARTGWDGTLVLVLAPL